MDAAIEGLPELVAAALQEEVNVTKEGASKEASSSVTNEPPPADPALARWQSIGPGLKEMTGGEPPPAVPVPQVTIQPPAPGRVKLPPAPRHMGMPVLSPQGQGYIARRNAARFKGEPFTELPPHDLSPFGFSNEP
jgi:hypothetical protein